ncbi:lysylphosphatidylglycerol synthase domain-containing protein [Leptospira wolffii]|uniref:Lysylphosphatidylglycerol synthase domain-containing protein n=1 Tax=Leptospira wolffii TaxID=409998 RepID=A0ABV5BMW8_9LEPT
MKKKIFLKSLMIALSALSLIYFFHILIPKLDQLPHIEWSPISCLIIFVCTLLYLTTTIIGGVNWGILLRDFGIQINNVEAIKITAFTQFGKYLPGNVGHHLGRLYIAGRKGIPAIVTIQTIFYETVILIATSLLIGLSGVIKTYNNPWDFWIRFSLVSLFIIASLTLPSKLLPSINKMDFKWLTKLKGNADLLSLNYSTIPKIISLNALSLSISGITLQILSIYIFHSHEENPLFLISAYTASWLLGYLIPGAPAGMGIREVTLMSMLSIEYDQETALALTILLRVISLTGDGLCFIISGLIGKKFDQPSIK